MPDTDTQTTTTTVSSPVSFSDSNNDGLPDNLADFLDKSDFRMDWENRRRAIFLSLKVLGVAFFLVVLVAMYLAVFKTTVDFNKEISSLLQTILWTVSVAFTGLISAYVFGAQFDANSFRNSTASIVTAVASNRNRSSVSVQQPAGSTVAVAVDSAAPATAEPVRNFG